VESARRYECRSVQSAQEYMMYLDTDAQMPSVLLLGSEKIMRLTIIGVDWFILAFSTADTD